MARHFPYESDRNGSQNRFGFTVIELVVCIAICAVLVALTMSAIQHARVAATRVHDRNNARQIGLATQNYVSEFGKLPEIVSKPPKSIILSTLFLDLLPYLEQAEVRRAWLYHGPEDLQVPKNYFIKTYVSPFDASHYGESLQSHPCSYAANAQVFTGFNKRTLAYVTDGLSTTIFFGQHYAKCGAGSFSYSTPGVDSWSDPPPLLQAPIFAYISEPYAPNSREDFYPITSGTPPTSRAAEGVTFQVRPKADECDPRQPSTGDPSGMPCVMGDGSVRVFARSISSEIFWAAVTPNRGEIFSE